MTNFFFILLIVNKLFFWTPFLVDGQSMDPTLHDREVVLIDRQLHPEDLKRGTIVVFSFEDNFFFIKRIVGLPGETLLIGKDGVQVKDAQGQFQKLLEPYLLNDQPHYGDTRYYIVPAGEYLMLGDNRDHSKDSRYFAYPYVKFDEIYGRFIYP